MGAMQRTKGAVGEREFASVLQEEVDKFTRGITMRRNLEQTQCGGFDIVGLPWLALEVKRQETLHLGQWWQQCLAQAGGRVPVLAYRQNRMPWRVRMLLDAYGQDIVAELSIYDFLVVFRGMLADPRYGVRT